MDESTYVDHSDSHQVVELENFGPLEIPQDSYFVLGDKRENSAHSRRYGPVPVELIRGKVFKIYRS